MLQVLAVQPAQLDLLEALDQPATLDAQALQAAQGALVLQVPQVQLATLGLQERRA